MRCFCFAAFLMALPGIIFRLQHGIECVEGYAGLLTCGINFCVSKIALS